MVKSLDSNGWSASSSVAARRLTREGLITEGIPAEAIDAQVELLKQDLKDGLLPIEEKMTPLEKSFRDPNQDEFILLFDGQHR